MDVFRPFPQMNLFGPRHRASYHMMLPIESLTFQRRNYISGKYFGLRFPPSQKSREIFDSTRSMKLGVNMFLLILGYVIPLKRKSSVLYLMIFPSLLKRPLFVRLINLKLKCSIRIIITKHFTKNILSLFHLEITF